MKDFKYTVVLDPGHGGRDPGAVANGLREKDLNLRLAHKIAPALSGVKVLLTRESDIFVSLKDRVALAARADADIFVSLHVNAGGGHGFESFVYQGLGRKDPARIMRRIIHKRAMNTLSRWEIRDRGKKDAAFYVLRYNKVPAMLIESLFIDNEREAGLWRDPLFPELLATGIAAGIMEAVAPEKQEIIQEGTEKEMPRQEESRPEPDAGEKTALPAEYLYAVQVGAFAVEENARRCLKKARKAGFDDAFIYKKNVS